MTAHPAELRPFYFMATFWGAPYRAYFTDLLLASLLAPNNIPALRRERNSKFLIVTTREDWDALQANPLFQRLRLYVEPIWFEMPFPGDEELKMLVMSRAHRQMATKAFQDRAYGVFLTPDLMLSNGSVVSMERLVAAGKKVVLTVAIRFRHETMLAELEQLGYFRPDCALAVESRDLMRVALRHLHSETLRYEFDTPWFAECPISMYWWVRGGDGMIIHSFSWAPLVVDYAALAHHDTRTFENWTLDGDYIYRNFPDPRDIYVVTDSDEISLVSFTKESDLHFELEPYLQNRSRAIVTWYKRQLVRKLLESDVMDPLKRHIFPTSVYLHAAEISPVWRTAQKNVAGVISRTCRPQTRLDKLITFLIAFAAPGLGLRLLGSFGGKLGFVLWAWRHRRFMWQRLREKTGLTSGRSRVDDGRDWVTPTLSLMNPVWSVRAMLRHKVYRDAVKGQLALRFPFRTLLRMRWRWRYRRLLWQRMKEKAGLVPGRSRVDDGRDWVTPTLSLMNPVWSVRAMLRDKVYRDAVKGQLALRFPFRTFLRMRWAWRYRRYVWQRLKEKTGLTPGRSRVDTGQDWVTPTLSLMNPVWSVRAVLRDTTYRQALKTMLVPDALRDRAWAVRESWRCDVESLYLMAGYTESLVDNPLDRARGIDAQDSKVGLFKENRDIGFYWFGRQGTILHATTFHLNNIGLMSRHDYVRERDPWEYRIVVLGDEMTAATTAEASWPDWLQEELNTKSTLLQRIGRERFSVLNFGWPDAGFSHYAKVWNEKARFFDPDLVIVNIVAHDFARRETGARVFFRGRPNTQWRGEYVSYRSPSGLEAWLVLACVGTGKNLKHHDCTCSRPFALYLPRALAENGRELAAVQDAIVDDYVSGRAGPVNSAGALLRSGYRGRRFDRWWRRDFEVTPGTPATTADMVAHAGLHLRSILDSHGNVIVTQNPWAHDFRGPAATCPMTEALIAADPSITVVDMREYLARDAGEDEIRSWYQTAYAAEKWSMKGHRVYAEAQARVVEHVLLSGDSAVHGHRYRLVGPSSSIAAV